MGIHAVLFDLDGTLVDTESVRPMRDNGDWRGAVRGIANTTLFPGIHSLLTSLGVADVTIAIVTSSVSYYASAVLAHHGLVHNTLVAFHDTKRHKPDPAPYLLALTRMGLLPSEALGVGDGGEDAQSLRGAEVQSCGAGWSPSVDIGANWDRYFRKPSELIRLITD